MRNSSTKWPFAQRDSSPDTEFSQTIGSQPDDYPPAVLNRIKGLCETLRDLRLLLRYYESIASTAIAWPSPDIVLRIDDLTGVPAIHAGSVRHVKRQFTNRSSCSRRDEQCVT